MVNKKWLNKINSLIYNFIFKGKKYMAGLKVSFPQEKGVINMLYIRDYSMAIIAKNFKKYFKDKESQFAELEKYICFSKSSLLNQNAKIYNTVTSLIEVDSINYKNYHKSVLELNEQYINYKFKKFNVKKILKFNFSNKIVNFIVKLGLKLLPNKNFLIHRNILKGDNGLCAFGCNKREDNKHIFSECYNNKTLLNKIIDQINIRERKKIETIILSEKNNYDLFNGIPINKIKFFYIFYYSCWINRCNFMFKNIRCNVGVVFEDMIYEEFIKDSRIHNKTWVSRFWDKEILKIIYY